MIRALVHGEGGTAEIADRAAIAALHKARAGFLWVDLEGAAPDEGEWLGATFDLHPLAVEDLLHRNQRPKLEEYEGQLLLVLHAVGRQGHGIVTSEVHLILASTYLLTVTEGRVEGLARVFERCRRDPRPMVDGGSHLLYLLSDAVVDAAFPVLDALEDEIEQIEDQILARPTRAGLRRVFTLKRDLVQLRRVLSPQREVYNALSRRGYPLVDARASLYFRDVHDHLVRASEMLEAYRDLLGNTLDAYLSMMSNRLNEVMRRLTIIATIFMPLSFVVGFFGMNFSRIPWDNRLIFIVVVALMVLIPGGMLFWFWRSGLLTPAVRLERPRVAAARREGAGGRGPGARA